MATASRRSRPASAPSPCRKARPSPPSPTTRPGAMASSSTPKSSTPPTVRELLANFVTKVAGMDATWTHGRLPRRQDRRDPRTGRRRQGHLRPVGRRRFLGRGAADPRSHRRPADLRLRRPWPAARRARPNRSSACSASITTSRSSMWTPAKPSWPALPASPTPKRSASSSAAPSSTCSRPRRRRSAARSSSRRARSTPMSSKASPSPAGRRVTIKSHHNVGGLPARMNMELVEPLRELFKDEVRAPRRRTRPAAGLRRPPPVPRPGPCHPHPRRSHAAKPATRCARPMPSTSTKSARPGFTTPSGRPSPCCCRSAPSA